MVSSYHGLRLLSSYCEVLINKTLDGLHMI